MVPIFFLIHIGMIFTMKLKNIDMVPIFFLISIGIFMVGKYLFVPSLILGVTLLMVNKRYQSLTIKKIIELFKHICTICIVTLLLIVFYTCIAITFVKYDGNGV